MVILVTAVTGSAAATVGKLLAQHLGWNFLDAEDFDSPASKGGTHRGIPLTDTNRASWVGAIHDELLHRKKAGRHVVLAWSRLKPEYWNILRDGLTLEVVYLRGSPEQLQCNFVSRENHFASENLIAREVATIDEPAGAIVAAIARTPEEIVEGICARLDSQLHALSNPVAQSDQVGESVIRKILWRVLPFLFLLYVVAYIDRVNIGFAALQMRQQLGFSDEIYGLGAGLFFAGYLLFQLPSNLVLRRVGARRWISVLMIVWGAISGSMMFVDSPKSFYALRFLLGAAEAGFFPGILFYFRSWFPARARARVVAMFMTAGPVSGILGGPLSGALLGLHNVRGLAGWQWLFLLEGLPAVLLGILALFLIIDRPQDASWLSAAECNWLTATLGEENLAASAALASPSPNLAAPARVLPLPAAPALFNTFANPRIWLFAFVYFGLNTCAYGITLWLPVALRSVTGFGNLVLGLLSTIPYLAAAIMMVVVGLHSDRTGDRRWHTAIAAFGSACALFVAGYAHSAAALLGAFTVAMVGVQSMTGPFWTMASSIFSGSTAAAGIALINSVGNLGSGFGPYWIGRMRTATGGFRAGLWSVAAILAVAAMVTILVPLPPTHSKRSAS